MHRSINCKYKYWLIMAVLIAVIAPAIWIPVHPHEPNRILIVGLLIGIFTGYYLHILQQNHFQ